MPRKIALAWSGGKDSTLALDRLTRAGDDVVALVTNVDRASRRDRAHGAPDFVVQQQAACLGKSLVPFVTDWEGYAAGLESALRDLKATRGVDTVAFGDVSLDAHRKWNEALAARVSLDALFPLWGEDHARVLAEVNARGYRAFVVAVKPPLDASFLGRWLDAPGFGEDVVARGASPAGEGGEYHSLVVDGPLFKRRLDVVALDPRPGSGDLTWLDVTLAPCP